jgi:hypothetical protein
MVSPIHFDPSWTYPDCLYRCNFGCPSSYGYILAANGHAATDKYP